MGEIAPAVSADGDANGYTAIHTKLTALQRAAAQLMEHAERVAQRMRANANAAVTVADLSAAAQVDARHVAAINEVATSFGRVVGGARRLSGAADSMHQAAGHLRTEHQAEYGGVHAAVTASKARQAKPGFYRPQ
ncbi:hypothetical protein BU52_30695 [Streptomyces toyocaensis]|uniref:Conjugal transfer protein TraB n=1 Tax=Streptomyces toyocaensis TaxID=55952 RepID=A0A081XIN6_STRTO|nr:hypothetical protein [Streptomyces toyocaensis]KES03409.1 hypothetical protein BU52_30695 [Streptomyces toyocaensis]